MNCPGVYRDYNRHSAILFKVGTKNVRYIEIEGGGLRIKYAGIEEFGRGYEEMVGYEIPKAVDRFLEFAQLHGITDGANDVLCSLKHGPKEIENMDENVKADLDKSAELKKAPAKKAAPKKAAVTPASKKPTAKAATTKAAPTKKAAPAAKKPASTKAESKPKAETRGRKAEWKDAPHKVADASAVGKGAIKVFVDHAAELKTFSLADMLKKFRNMKDFSEERVLRYFAWCRSKGIFAEKG